MDKVNDKLFNWASDIDPEAIRQAERTARLPIVDRVALMPDAHVGLGATVGSVIGTREAIIPSAVGVDIGCGMCAVELDMTASQLPDDLAPFMPLTARAIPAGVGQGHEHTSRAADTWLRQNEPRFTTDLDQRHKAKIVKQFGSLGSGNHFFEICLDERDQVWIVLHSGSRGIGNLLARDHIKEAKRVCKDKRLKLEDADLAYFEEADAEFGLYIADMLACQDYARANRDQMMTSALAAFKKWIGHSPRELRRINCHHNFTELEVHDEENVWVTRKGAIRAGVGDFGVIPGSMGAASFIISGKGEGVSYHSCSHGAGRRLSRSAAKKEFTAEDLVELMGDRTWMSDKATSLIDEIPLAYKDIDMVMADQTDLVEVEHQLRQVFNYKGA